MTSRAHRLLLALALPFALVACSDDNDSPASAGPVTPPTAETTLAGSIVKGATANAIVTIIAADGHLLATTESSDMGAYSVTLPSGYTGAVTIVATAKDYTATEIPAAERTQMRCDAPSGCRDAYDNSIVFGDWFEVPLDFELSAVAYVNGWGIHLANVTPLSTLAAEWAAMFPQGLDAESVNSANSTVAAMFGLALSDLEEDISDIADPLWLEMASPQQVQLALLYATFAEINTQYGMPTQQVLQMLVDTFVGQGGSLVQVSEFQEPSVAFLADLSRQLLDSATLAGVIDMPAETYNGVQSSMGTLLAGLQSGEMTTQQPVSYDHIITTLGPMGAQIDELLTISNLKNPAQFRDEQWPYFSWLAHEDNLQMLPVAVEALVAVALSSVWLDIAPADETALVMPFSITDQYAVTLNVPERKLTLLGTSHGQQVDLVIGVTSLTEALAKANTRFNFSVRGTVSNDTASGSIDAEITVDPKNVDFSPVLAVIETMRSTTTTPYQKFAALVSLPVIAAQYAYTLDAEIWAGGSATLARNEDPSQAVEGSFELQGFVDLGATGAQKLLSIDLKDVDLRLPARPGEVNHIYSHNGKHVMRLELTQDLDVTVNGAAQAFGVPEAVLSASGRVSNARLYFDHVRDTLAATLTTAFGDMGGIDTVDDVPTVLAQLVDFDFSQMSASGNALITIAALDHEYRARLDDLLVTVFQPRSNAVALTAELRPSQQKIHFVLGAAQEPWDLRVLTTPTPRLALIGPDGQYAEATQEDVYTLLDTLQIRDLLDRFVTELFGEPV